eukprot:TRINITY_DN4923_c0_g1_i2.p2 TRINITY_DN4923_c0_g1~~TRINITY_DN4923_c0_g1_i2.p2  ORF type:complete len:148 (-),score=6.53 TRINITY_DN4923_c0_g1_i2:1019-1462(-)
MFIEEATHSTSHEVNQETSFPFMGSTRSSQAITSLLLQFGRIKTDMLRTRKIKQVQQFREPPYSRHAESQESDPICSRPNLLDEFQRKSSAQLPHKQICDTFLHLRSRRNAMDSLRHRLKGDSILEEMPQCNCFPSHYYVLKAFLHE